MPRKLKYRTGNYVPKVLEAVRQITDKHGVWTIRVKHDDWCAHWRGAACNCEPQVTMRKVKTT